MRPVNWGRLLTAMVTPFNESLGVDYEMAGSLATFLIDSGTDGVVVNGTTGESPSTTLEEKIRLLDRVLEAVGDRATVIAGTGTNSTVDSISLTRAAERAGAHGVMLVTPYYNKPPQEGLYDHFRRVAESTSLPIMLYNVPGRTGVNLLPATVERLSEIANVVAVKEAGGNLDQVTEILRRVPEDFLVYSGDDSLTLPILSLGGYGVVSVASHVAGPLLKQMITMHVSGNPAEAAKAHRELFPVFKALFMTTSPIPVKAALKIMGYDVGPARPPLSRLSESEDKALRQAMVQTGILSKT